MGNTFESELMPRILGSALMVLREKAALATAVAKDFAGLAAQQGETVTVEVPAAQAVEDVTPAAVPPSLVDTTPSKVQVTLNKWKASRFHLTTREQKAILAGSFVPGQIGEAVRALVNQVNSDLFALYKYVYGYIGTAGTNPFAASVDPTADLRGMLNGQLCPEDGRMLIIGDAEETAALKLAEFKSAAVRGDANTLRSGVLGNVNGFEIRRDSARPTHTSSGVTGAAVDHGGGYAAGVSTLAIKTASGAPAVGDIITFAGHDQTYVILAGSTQTSFVISPALKSAVADSEAITFKPTHKVNLGFDPRAFALAIRVLEDSIEGEPTLGRHLVMTDALTQIPLKLSFYPGYESKQWRLSIFYGCGLVDPRLIARHAG